MNRKGQALVEFVLVLPVLIFMLLAFIDVGKLLIMKNHLEGLWSTITIDTTSISDKEYDVKLEKEEHTDYVLIKLESCMDTITPGLNKLGNGFRCVKTSKEFKRD